MSVSLLEKNDKFAFEKKLFGKGRGFFLSPSQKEY
jgi:hypothetical protein